MMERLTAGCHPDTDPTFWNDWHDPGPPVVRDPRDIAADRDRRNTAIEIVLALCGVLVLSIRIVRSFNRQRAAE